MHYHMELIMPPTDDVEGSIRDILGDFREHEDERDALNPHAFFDWYVIGGRWSQEKLLSGLSSVTLDRFQTEIIKRKITVSGITAGRPQLSPSSQIPMVDALWKEFFPDYPFEHCPLFEHSRVQCKDQPAYPDVMKLVEMPAGLRACHCLIAAQDLQGKLGAHFMIQSNMHNGVNYVEVAWDRRVWTAVSMFREKIKNYSEESRARVTPQEDWLVVTVDYHN